MPLPHVDGRMIQPIFYHRMRLWQSLQCGAQAPGESKRNVAKYTSRAPAAGLNRAAIEARAEHCMSSDYSVIRAVPRRWCCPTGPWCIVSARARACL